MDSEWAKNPATCKKSKLEAKGLQQEKDLNGRSEYRRCRVPLILQIALDAL
jgi:hypothetical protein